MSHISDFSRRLYPSLQAAMPASLPVPTRETVVEAKRNGRPSNPNVLEEVVRPSLHVLETNLRKGLYYDRDTYHHLPECEEDCEMVGGEFEVPTTRRTVYERWVTSADASRPEFPSAQIVGKADEGDRVFTGELLPPTVEFMIANPLLFGPGFHESYLGQARRCWNKLEQVAGETGIDCRPYQCGMDVLRDVFELVPESMAPKERYKEIQLNLAAANGSEFWPIVIEDRDGEPLLSIEQGCLATEGVNHGTQPSIDVPCSWVAVDQRVQNTIMGPLAALAANSSVINGVAGWDNLRMLLWEQSIGDKSFPRLQRYGFLPAERDVLSLAKLYRKHANMGRRPFTTIEKPAKPTEKEIQAYRGTVWMPNRHCWSGNDVFAEIRWMCKQCTLEDDTNMIFFISAVQLAYRYYYDMHGVKILMNEAECERNAQAAFRKGLSAEVTWIDPRTGKRLGDGPVPVMKVLKELYDIALDFVTDPEKFGEIRTFSQEEAAGSMEGVKMILEGGQNGARWQRKFLAERTHKGMEWEDIRHEMVDAILTYREKYGPHVALWSPVRPVMV